MKRGEPLHGRGAAAGSLEEWVNLASRGILDVLDEQLAVPRAELEARLSEEGVILDGWRVHFDPHVVTGAMSQLREIGVVEEYDHATKGGATVTLIIPADQRGRATYITRAIRRKAMLYSRWRKLADLSGPAGEEVLRRSLSQAGPHLIEMAPGFGEVKTVLGVTTHGSLDSGAWFHSIDQVTGRPRQLHALPMEMKNRRLTIYPIHKEIHQLLSKAAAIQVENPDYPIVPILVCRRAHPRLFWMARDLGFRVWATKRQFTALPKGMDRRLVEEIRTELRLTDLTLVGGDDKPTIRQFFTEIIPKNVPDAAPRWAAAAPVVKPYADMLRTDAVESADRQELLRQMRQKLENVMSDAGFTDPFKSWSLPDLDEEHEDYEE